MSTAERVITLIKYLGLNAKSFSEHCGYDRPQVIYDVIKGKTRNISPSMCEKIMAAVPGLNRTWLLTGDGEMLLNSAAPEHDEQVVKVPLVPLAAFAGPIHSYYEPGVELDRCEKIISPNAQADMALPITGDSMEPMFSDGSVVFIKRINEAAFIPWGHPMVLDTENGVFIKNVMPDDEDDSYIWAISVNPKYPRMHIPKKSIMAIYRVLNVQKSFTTM